MSRVKSYNGLQFALAPPSENSMAMTSYTNNVVFKSALIIIKMVSTTIFCSHNINDNMVIDFNF